MAIQNKDVEFGGRYLIQDQDHMGGIKPGVSNKAEGQPLTGTPGSWVKAEPGKQPHAAAKVAGRR